MTDDWDIVFSTKPFPVPFRKFVAGTDWATVGPVIREAADETYSHLALDTRVWDAFPDGHLTGGWLCGEGRRLQVRADLSLLADGARAEIEAWAASEDVELDFGSTPPEWLPGR